MSKPLYRGRYCLSPEKYVEYALCDLKKVSEKIRLFHKDYHIYLATQRNLLKDEILSSLKKVGIKKEQGVFYRVFRRSFKKEKRICQA